MLESNRAGRRQCHSAVRHSPGHVAGRAAAPAPGAISASAWEGGSVQYSAVHAVRVADVAAEGRQERRRHLAVIHTVVGCTGATRQPEMGLQSRQAAAAGGAGTRLVAQAPAAHNFPGLAYVCPYDRAPSSSLCPQPAPSPPDSVTVICVLLAGRPSFITATLRAPPTAMMQACRNQRQAEGRPIKTLFGR